LALCVLAATAAPPTTNPSVFARWMVQELTWGVLSTTSTRSKGTTVGTPFGNPYSISDVAGVPYIYVSDLDASATDLFGPGGNTLASISLSEASMQYSNGSAASAACRIGAALGDPENPPCARLVITGTISQLKGKSEEQKAAYAALCARHPYFKKLPSDHDFYVAKMNVTGLWLINAYGGATIIPPSDYFQANVTTDDAAALAPPSAAVAAADKPAAALDSSPPWFWDTVGVARWMVSNLDWGVLSTTSTRSEGTTVGTAFGNPYSFADVGGVPYFYVTDMDASLIDVNGGKANASLSLSEAALFGKKSFTWKQKCQIGQLLGDPENPPCARLVLSGTMAKVPAGSAEETSAKAALVARHPSFALYPPGHGFYVAKMELSGLWEIDMFGGAAIISPEDYFKAKP